MTAHDYFNVFGLALFCLWPLWQYTIGKRFFEGRNKTKEAITTAMFLVSLGLWMLYAIFNHKVNENTKTVLSSAASFVFILSVLIGWYWDYVEDKR